ncbi:MAG TPA: PAS domain-containing protein [Bacteroidales bacterium]|nr:PAS domain-containing protein [Bacteroidales bacterium]HPI86739.1 PAS domain-containing protein [Bacteroidales bacterium]
MTEDSRNERLKVLSVEDSVRDFELIKEYLSDLSDNLDIIRVEDEQDYKKALQGCHWDIILADFRLPGFDAFRALNISKTICPDTPFICVSGAIGEETAIELLKQGTLDFVMKDKLDRLPLAVERALTETQDKLARKKSEADLLHFHELMRYIIEHNRSAVAVFDNNLHYIYVSQRFLQEYNVKEKNIIGRHHYDIFPDHPERWKEVHRRVLAGEVLSAEDDPYFRDSGEVEMTRWECRPWYESDGAIGGMVLYTEVITDRKRAEIQALLTAKILTLLNSSNSLHETIRLTVDLIKKETGIEAVGIRIKKNEDFPYLCHKGFKREFVEDENSLFSRSDDGSILRGNDGLPLLECTCGLVVSGKTEESSPFYTKGGSFWTNDSEVMLGLKPDQDIRYHPRNTCVHAGYRSIAIIPIRAGEEIIGLLQLNDSLKNRFTSDMILFFESVGNMIGVAFTRRQAQEAVEASHKLLFKLSEQVPGVIYQYRLFPDGRSCFPYASSGMNMIYEVTPEEVREDATPVFGRLHPDDLQRVSDLIMESARELSHFYCEFRVNLPKAGVKWRYSDAVPELLEDGSTLWHGIIYDITRVKEAEADLTKKMEELQKFHNFTVDRELMMIELKKEVNGLLVKSGLPPKYRIVD